MHSDLLISLALIEDLSRCRISIVDANDTMAPSSAHQSLALAKEALLLLVVTNLSELVPESFNFFSSFFGCAQTNVFDRVLLTRRVFIKQCFFDRLHRLDVLALIAYVTIPFTLEHKRLLTPLFHSWHSVSLLQRRRSILQVDKMLQFGLLAAQVHEGDAWFDGLRVFGEVGGLAVGRAMLHHRSLVGEHLIVIHRIWLI